jgi:hypothetical protein
MSGVNSKVSTEERKPLKPGLIALANHVAAPKTQGRWKKSTATTGSWVPGQFTGTVEVDLGPDASDDEMKVDASVAMQVDADASSSSGAAPPAGPHAPIVGSAGAAAGVQVPGPPPRSREPCPTWPAPPCSVCSVIKDNHRNMMQVKNWVSVPPTAADLAFDALAVDGYYSFIYTCSSCVQKDRGCTPAEAKAACREERHNVEKQKARAEKFRVCEQNVLGNEEFANASKKGKRLILRMDWLQLWKPVMKNVQLKCEQLRSRTGLTEEHTRLIAALKASSSVPEIELMLQKLTELEDQIAEKMEPLAFKVVNGVTQTREQQFRWQMAADYGDCWVETQNTNGTLLGGFCSYYICMSNHGQCATLILSKVWTRKHEDPLASKQNWKCVCCGTNYKTRMGMLIETRLLGNPVPVYALAPCCTHDEKDLKSLILQDKYAGQVLTPEDLYNIIPDHAPTEGPFLRKATKAEFAYWVPFKPEGVYKIMNVEALQKAKRWNWNNVYHFFNGVDVVDMNLVEC